MDFLVELIVGVIVQCVVEIVGELLIETALSGAASALESRIGRWTLATLLGGGFGVFWGHHLSGQASWPKLLWVSLGFAAVAFLVSMLAPPSAKASTWRELVQPPWRWSADRLLGLGVLNIALAAGIVIGFRHGHT